MEDGGTPAFTEPEWRREDGGGKREDGRWREEGQLDGGWREPHSLNLDGGWRENGWRDRGWRKEGGRRNIL
jgi:hypothetical protein